MEKQPQDEQQYMMKIGQLSARSGVSRSSIHHYLNVGLLPKPVIAGLNIHLYSGTHLAILREIKRLRDEKNLSLAEIKKRLEKTDWSSPAVEMPDDNTEPLEPASPDSRRGNDLRREQIVEKATDLFSRIGYEAVRIGDITAALRMSKATFYEYFQGKEQLFIECIERLVVEIVPREGWKAIREETDYFKKQNLRARHFLNSFPGYSGILQQARIFSRVDNQEMAAKAKETFNIMTRPLQTDIENARRQGAIRPFDAEIVAHMLLGQIEGLGWKMMVDPGLDLEQVMESINDLLRYGLVPREVSDKPIGENMSFYANVLDIQGVETMIGQPRFDGRDYLEAKAGEALIKISPGHTNSLKVDQVETDSLRLSVSSVGDQVLTVTVPVGLKVTGQTSFGEFSIPMDKVAEIRFKDHPASSIQ